MKWNFAEFTIDYENRLSKTKVWKYYLDILLVEDEDRDGFIRPMLHKDFEKKDAKKLWDHLLEVFIPEFSTRDNLVKRQLILKCLILLYRKYSKSIGPMKLIPYWLRLLQDSKEKHCYFLVLQLLLVALDAPYKSEEAIYNFKIFEDANGLQIMMGCLNYGYQDLYECSIYKQIRQTQEN